MIRSSLQLLQAVRVAVCLTTALLVANPALAALKPGSKAPEFKTQASLGDNVSNVDLDAVLKQRPVVLYFYPAAFIQGCTIEAHLFADAVRPL